MQVERPRPTEVRVTSAARDIAVLISAARWAVAGCPGRLPAEAIDQLRRVLVDYDVAIARAGDRG
jgi:hypothetical protein